MYMVNMKDSMLHIDIYIMFIWTKNTLERLENDHI